MTPSASPTMTAEAWVDLILGSVDAAETWTAIFSRLRDLALAGSSAGAIHRETIAPDRLLAEAAWDLWQEFPRCAPRVVDELKRFWVAPAGSGTAVLILDGLSLRELPLIVAAGRQRGVEPTRVEVRAAEVPTETDRFAQALGVPSRSSLYNNKPPSSFLFSGPDLHTDVLEGAFLDCIGAVSHKPRHFLWHKWPDDDLVHGHEDDKDGPSLVAAQTKKTIHADDFWSFVERLRQGRRLVITGDHGYADADSFSSEEKKEETVKLLRSFFGASRCVRENPARPWPRQHVPPLVCQHDGWLVVMGQRKWAVQGGFPHLCHRGLSLLEAAVPLIEYPPN